MGRSSVMDLALPVHLTTAQLVALTVGLAVGIAMGAITGVLMVVENRDRALARRFDLFERLLPHSPRTAEVSAVAWEWYRALQEEKERADRAERHSAGMQAAADAERARARGVAGDEGGHNDEDREEADDPCITFCPSPAFAGGEPCTCAAFRRAPSD